jgi:hypothetical protein
MARYKVSTTRHGERMTTTKYWTKKSNAQKYADITSKNRLGSYPRVVKCKK